MPLTKEGQLWKQVSPLLQVWILIPQIQQLKLFQTLFKELIPEEKRLVIWFMMQEAWCFQAESPRIQDVQDIVTQSHNLIDLPPLFHHDYTDRRNSYRFIIDELYLLFVNCYLSIYQICSMMTSAIQTSCTSVHHEMALVYNVVCRDLEGRDMGYVQSPSPVLDHERRLIRFDMQTSNRRIVRELMLIHRTLDLQCTMYLESKIDATTLLVKTEVDRLHNLVELAQAHNS